MPSKDKRLTKVALIKKIELLEKLLSNQSTTIKNLQEACDEMRKDYGSNT